MPFAAANGLPSSVNGTLLSDLELARLEAPHKNDEALVRQLARQTVAELGLVAPVDPRLVASFRGIARVEEVDQPWAGCLTHDSGETVARVRASDSRRRKRFTTFHEVQHTYLPGFSVTQYRCDPTPTSRSLPHLETLADIGASELLFPRDEFIGDLDGNRLDFDLVEELADHYDASLGATALRTVGLAPTPTLLICAEVGTKPRDPDGEPVLRIRWSSPNGDWPFVPRFKSVPRNSPMHRALHGELVDEVNDLRGLGTPPLDGLDLSCRLYPYVDRSGEIQNRVLCIATKK